jgi:hypothetical protein
MTRMDQILWSPPLGASPRRHTVLGSATVIRERLSHQSLADKFPAICQADISFALVALGKYGAAHALLSLGSNREDHLNPIGFLAGQVLSGTWPVFVNGTQ